MRRGAPGSFWVRAANLPVQLDDGERVELLHHDAAGALEAVGVLPARVW